MSTDGRHYEALPYSWGGHLMLRRLITLNRRSYLVTDTVFNALKELRLPDQERYLWIDAICINQGDLEERAWQVALMDSIYQRAQKVIVWLGNGSIQLNHPDNPVFHVIRNSDDEREMVIKSIRDSVEELLRARWWSRVWIVQEIALARSVVVRSGRNEVSWDALTKCLQRLTRIRIHSLDTKILSFVDSIAELKSLNSDHERSLLELAVRFRDRVAGNPRDNVLGYLGLLQQPTTHSVVRNPYRKTTEGGFAHFTASCISSSGSLATMAIAEGLATHKASWAVDWAMMTSPDWRDNDPLADEFTSKKEPPMAFWTGNLLPSVSENTGRRYNATQSVPAVSHQERLLWSSLYVSGWNPEVVKSVGQIYSNVKYTAEKIRSWEKLAGGPWTSDADPQRVRFYKTLLADAWVDIPPQDWPERCQEQLQQKSIFSEFATTLCTSERIFHASCFRRRFFITRTGRFGLGPESTSKNDDVWVLLGSPVPFILSRSNWEAQYKFRGQAYVDGLMDYEGDPREDIRTHKVKTYDFTLY
ncbi:MAG: hypothetical protein Q9221_006342 [Calogaya cf. arnoldii]